MPRNRKERSARGSSGLPNGSVREAAAAYVAGLPGKEKPVRKNFYLTQSKIDMAKKLIGARTETEAVDVALEMLVYGEALALGTEGLVGQEYHDVLGIATEAPATEESE